MASRLTEKYSRGIWWLKGVPWSSLTPGNTITKENFKKLYEALDKLKDYVSFIALFVTKTGI